MISNVGPKKKPKKKPSVQFNFESRLNVYCLKRDDMERKI